MMAHSLSAGLLFLLTGCVKKVGDLPYTSPLCDIQTIIGPSGGEGIDTIRFSYDSYAHPIGITRKFHSTGVTDYIFWYDDQHRLTDFIGIASPTAFDTWDKYKYKDGRIVVDSTFNFGFIVDKKPAPYAPMDSNLIHGKISYFGYDDQGRMNLAIDSFPNGFTQANAYFYGRDGNLAKVSVVVSQKGDIFGPDTTVDLYSGYDHEVNLDRTNPIWQFIDRDFSVNNRFTADKYNEVGLPTSISNPNEGSPALFPIPFSYLGIGLRTIQYSCQIPGTENGHGH